MNTRAQRVESFIENFSDSEIQIELEKLRWPSGMICPACGAKRSFSKTTRRGVRGEDASGYYVCLGKTERTKRRPLNTAESEISQDVTKKNSNAIRSWRYEVAHKPAPQNSKRPDQRLVFTVRTGTILARSHIPLCKWACALGLRRLTRNTVTATALGTLLGAYSGLRDR